MGISFVADVRCGEERLGKVSLVEPVFNAVDLRRPVRSYTF